MYEGTDSITIMSLGAVFPEVSNGVRSLKMINIFQLKSEDTFRFNNTEI